MSDSMKSLIRHQGETILSTSNIDGIEWETGAPLTNPSWAGGAYALCSDCPYSDVEPSDFDITTEEIPSPGDPLSEDETPSTITRLIATFNQEKYDARKQEETE